MAFSNGYTLGFAGAICVVCSLGVASASLGLRPFQDANKKREFQMQILTAVGLGDEASAAAGEGTVETLYTERIREVYIDLEGKALSKDNSDKDEDGDLDYADVKRERKEAKMNDREPTIFPVFQRMDSGKAVAYAFELNGKGLWGPISGYLAVKPDGSTVLGATFDAPKETPGLGAEIMYDNFRGQWKDKRIVNDAGELEAIRVVKGSASLACPGREQHCVDGVSGATITSVGVDKMVESALTDVYKNYLNTIRSGTGG
jgi:Na+-transporting NADH:ubiquinone oxidoreductase subunit C